MTGNKLIFLENYQASLDLFVLAIRCLLNAHGFSASFYRCIFGLRCSDFSSKDVGYTDFRRDINDERETFLV